MLKHIIYFIIVVATGCASFNGKAGSFNQTALSFENALRWGKYEIAAGHIEHNSTGNTEEKVSLLQNVKITSYEIKKSIKSENKSEVRRTVQIKYYNVSDMLEKSVTFIELWILNSDTESWYLSNGLPELR